MKKLTLIFALLLLTSCAQNSAGTPQTTVSQTTVQTASVTDAESAVSETGTETAATETEDAGAYSETLAMSAEGGYYAEPFDLEITAPKGCTVYYTTDGSDPDNTKTPYTKPIHLIDRSGADNVISAITGVDPDNNYVPKKVKKANVIRAAAVDENGEVTETMTRTFFVGTEPYGIPVISIVTDPKNLFNKHDGIYVMGDTFDEWKAEQTGFWAGWQAKANYTNRGREWERPVSIEYITADGVQLSQNCGMRIMGAASRSNAQKSLRFTAREEYGKKNFKYPLIPGNVRSDGSGEVDKYRTFGLRNGGNDCNFAKMRDPVLQELMADTDIETMQYTPAIAFIDGEYWGMYALTEYYDDHYIENNYGRDDTTVFDDDNIIYLKKGEIEDGREEDIELYNEMYDFAVSADLNDPANYEKLSSMIDLDSFADYLAFNIYIHNSDAIYDENNWAMWRVRETDDRYEKADGKWRIMIYDTDYSSGIYDGSEFQDNNLDFILKKVLPDETDKDGNKVRSALRFMRALTDCDTFREKFTVSLCDIRNINFERTKAVDEVMRVYDTYSQYVPDTFDRFGPDWVAGNGSAHHFDGQVTNFANFLDERYFRFPDMVAEALKPGEKAELKISYDDTKGRVYLNGKLIPPEFSGIYFTEYPVTLTVTDGGQVSADGAVCTSVGDGYVLDLSEANTVTVTF
ncbi:MAG: CotH kinase family protein [Oscillospiraceae bacterium]|nr:CotH kinase family protein [Oscillospiraceae bacterium]